MTSRLPRVLLVLVAATACTPVITPAAVRNAPPGAMPERDANAPMAEGGIQPSSACRSCLSELKDSATLLAAKGSCEIEIDFAGGTWKDAADGTGLCMVQPTARTVTCDLPAGEQAEIAVFAACACTCEPEVRHAGMLLAELTAPPAQEVGE